MSAFTEQGETLWFFFASLLLKWTTLTRAGASATACGERNTFDSFPTKASKIKKHIPDVWGRTKSTQTTQWERSSNSTSLALVLVELRWYGKRKKKNYRTDDGTNEEKEGAEKRKGGKSHEIKQSVPRARWRSDCVAEWVILLHLLPQQGVGGLCVYVYGFKGVWRGRERERE